MTEEMLLAAAATGDGQATREELVQYGSQRTGFPEADLMGMALDEVFGEGASIGFHAIDQMQELIEEAYQKHEAQRLTENF